MLVTRGTPRGNPQTCVQAHARKGTKADGLWATCDVGEPGASASGWMQALGLQWGEVSERTRRPGWAPPLEGLWGLLPPPAQAHPMPDRCTALRRGRQILGGDQSRF